MDKSSTGGSSAQRPADPTELSTPRAAAQAEATSSSSTPTTDIVSQIQNLTIGTVTSQELPRVEDGYENWDPLADSFHSVLNTNVGAGYEPSALMIGGSIVHKDYTHISQVPCMFPVINNGRCWKGYHCVRAHSKEEEEEEDEGRMIQPLLAKKMQPSSGKSFKAYVSFINSPMDFYIFPTEPIIENAPTDDYGDDEKPFDHAFSTLSGMSTALERIMSRILKREILDKSSYVAGELVACHTSYYFNLANPPTDKRWMRAVVLTDDEDKYGVTIDYDPVVKVQLIDTGEITTVGYGDVSRLPLRFTFTQPLAYRCRLYHLQAEGSKFSNDKHKQAFMKLVGGEHVRVHILQIQGKGLLGKTWYDHGVSEVVPISVELHSPHDPELLMPVSKCLKEQSVEKTSNVSQPEP